MPFQALLDELIRSVPGAQAALLLDALGERVVEAGERDYRHRLIGAYQGIALNRAREASARHDVGMICYLLGRYRCGTLILRPLKDGYYLVVSLAPGGIVGKGVERSRLVQERMNAEL